jgi:serine/threonine protein kinase
MTIDPATAPSGSEPLLARYRIGRLLGAGGMGEVFEATDLQLGRRVALKMLPAGRATDPARVSRFVREAQTASALSHPAIVTVYDAGTAANTAGQPVHFLAMELLEGETLAAWARTTRDRTKRLEVLAQIADGLAAAHNAGIVHRDLKPENIVVTRGGWPKIVDFGIAKLTERAPGPSAGSDTAPSALIGTAGYMAPEQVAGGSVDHRSDVFAFGCVLYAVMTGRPPFTRANPVETMHAILNDDVPPLADAELARIARRCLAKDPEERYQSMRDVALDLRDLVRVPHAGAPPRARRRGTLFFVFAAAVVLTAAALLAWQRFRSMPPQPQVSMLRVTNTGRVTCGTISPDGNYVVHADDEGEMESIRVRQIATGQTVQVTPPSSVYHFMMRVSPDGNYIYYSAAARSEPNIADVYRVPLLGGTARKVAADVEFVFSLAPDGKSLVYRRFNALTRDYVLWLADMESGSERELLRWSRPAWMGDPIWSPDGRHVTFRGRRDGPRNYSRTFELDVLSHELRTLPPPRNWPEGIGNYTWLPDSSGILAAVSDPHQPQQLWLLGMDGSARKLTSDIAGYGEITVAADGRSLVARRRELSSNLVAINLDRPNEARALTSGIGSYYGATGVRWISPKEIVYTSFATGTPTVTVMNLERHDTRELAQGFFWNLTPSPDGRLVGGMTVGRSGSDVVVIDSAAGGRPRAITHSGNVDTFDWMPDGRSIVVTFSNDLQVAWLQPIDGGPAQRLTDVPVNTLNVSPDGKQLLCRMRSTKPGTPLWQTAVVPLAGSPLHAGTPRVYPVPRIGGPSLLAWTPDGNAFTYCDYDGGAANIWLQPLDGSAPRQLTRFESGQIGAYSLAADGKSVVVARGDESRDLVLLRDFR